MKHKAWTAVAYYYSLMAFILYYHPFCFSSFDCVLICLLVSCWYEYWCELIHSYRLTSYFLCNMIFCNYLPLPLYLLAAIALSELSFWIQVIFLRRFIFLDTKYFQIGYENRIPRRHSYLILTVISICLFSVSTFVLLPKTYIVGRKKLVLEKDDKDMRRSILELESLKEGN